MFAAVADGRPWRGDALIPSMQHLDQGARHAVIEAISEEMQAPLRAVTEGGHVVMPFHGLLVTAERR